MPPALLELPVPRDFILARDACSYGYFLLEPNLWDPATRSLRRTLSLPAGAATFIIDQPPAKPARGGLRASRGRPLIARADRSLSTADRAAASAQIARMLRLDEDHAHVREFHCLDPRWKASGRARLFRSPSLFEDVIKTVTSCNVTWPGTVGMNRRLCAVYGEPSPSGHRAFPTPRVLARLRPASLRSRCKVGYRDARIVALARLFARNAPAVADLESPALADDRLLERLLELPGVGPYAAHNILQLLGRYAHLPLDTESVRHGRTILGFKGPSRAIMRRVERHFAPFGPHRFRAYWFEMWAFYEAKRGPSHTWERERVGSSFTASQF
ncbi:MAG: hypothetical protein JNK35_10160 [Phycisphaerae bacterium]|nr:hypothetical protein [Phycisphaerae bacterium]